MAAERARKARKGKIAPFDYTAAANAPALKGMTSFLDISPEVLRETNILSMERPGAIVLAEAHAIAPVNDLPAKDIITPGNVLSPGGDTSPALAEPRIIHEAISISASAEGERLSGGNVTPGGERYPGGSPYLAHAPGVGRSKVRRCVLAQDGHSLGEEAIYQILWKMGEPDRDMPQGARTVRAGAAEISLRANMAKKNVRQNISRLYEKLAIEILEDFETVSSRPRLYRIYSYKQILERRREAGLEYVLRNKGVVFCTAEGAEIDLSARINKASGDETSLRPAQSKRQRIVEGRLRAMQEPQAGNELERILEAIGRHWIVDEEAGRQLIRSCRQVRSDAKIDEILFFLDEKIGRIRQSRGIVNPVGLLLATVPRCFAGTSFDSFRQQPLRQQQIEQEEARRHEEEDAALREWVRAEVAKCESIVNDPLASQVDKDRAEVRLRGFASWNQ